MERKEKIIRVAQIMGKLNAGGVESVIYNYYKNINHNKIQFDFIIDEDSKVEIPSSILELGARCFVVPPYQNIFKYISTLKKLFKENNYSIVHSNMTTISVFSLYAAKKAKVPIRICHSHSTAGKGETVRNILKYVLRIFSKIYATDYFACSVYAGEWLFGRKELKKGNIKIINNAIDVDAFKYDLTVRENVRKELGLENNFVIGHAGRFVTQKNHSFLVDVFFELQKNYSDAVLILLGDGPLRAEIEEKVDNLGISGKVKFLGIQKTMSKYYQAMDCFVMPSLYEGLPVVGVEAQASGLPVIASTSMTQEIKISHSFKMLSLSDNVEAWCSSILKSKFESRITDMDLFKEFNIKMQAKKLEEFYLGKF